MVLVYHLNRRLKHYKFLCLVALPLYLLFVYTFEALYHILIQCPDTERIDVVYTWVNGSDPRFLKQLNSYGAPDNSGQRYDDKYELMFSLRSLEKYAPWVGHVYIVTNGQIPYWLNLDYDGVTLVTHEQIFTDDFNLPTFSSPAIEMHLHRIPGISKRFIYLNDDCFLGAPVYADDFYSQSRGFLVYLAWLLPNCSPECSWLYVADGHCDKACFNHNCQMDGGDCDAPTSPDVNFTQPTQGLFKIVRNQSVSELIARHNKNVILLDKLRRRKVRKMAVLGERVDAYAASLQHTNRVLNEFYGFSVRKVPAHAPIMIDRGVMEEMQRRFKKYFDKTARNRFRSGSDMQFAFSYYYFLIHEEVEVDIGTIFDGFDTDSSGTWSDTELRTVLASLYDLPLTESSFNRFTSSLINCSIRSILPNFVITKTFVINCHSLSSLLKLVLGTKPKYKYELIKDAEKKYVSFKMLNSNYTEANRQLDDIRKNAKKFVCLNDNLDQTLTKNNQVVKRLMFDFYMSLFPVPSKFELSERFRNKYSYVEDYDMLVESRRRKFLAACVLMVVITAFLLFHLFRKRLCGVIKACFW